MIITVAWDLGIPMVKSTVPWIKIDLKEPPEPC